jgi:hypothetical protein
VPALPLTIKDMDGEGRRVEGQEGEVKGAKQCEWKGVWGI